MQFRTSVALFCVAIMATGGFVFERRIRWSDRDQTEYQGGGFGEVRFPISCSAEAQRQFDQAVAMLHSFQFPDTVGAFSLIAATEPSCAMAFWGVAISQRPNPLVGPFSGNILRMGKEAIERARTAVQQTPRERMWIEALAKYYDEYETVGEEVRTERYEKAMERVHEAYPDDTEASIFYALALIEAADPSDNTFAQQLEAARILEELERRYPNHPGIVHYLIHSYDQPSLAILGLSAALRCGRLAPTAPHALHMPSHIFSTLGMWDRVIASECRQTRRRLLTYGEPAARQHQ